MLWEIVSHAKGLVEGGCFVWVVVDKGLDGTKTASPLIDAYKAAADKNVSYEGISV